MHSVRILIVRFLLACLMLFLSACFSVTTDGISAIKSPATSSEKPADPSGWVLSNNLNQRQSETNNPIITASGLSDMSGYKVEVYFDATCSTLKGSATISGSSFSITNIFIADDNSEIGKKTFYGKIINTDNVSSNCTNLGLEYVFLNSPQLAFSNSKSIAINTAENKAFIVDSDLATLFEVDLTNGKKVSFPTLAQDLVLALFRLLQWL